MNTWKRVKRHWEYETPDGTYFWNLYGEGCLYFGDIPGMQNRLLNTPVSLKDAKEFVARCERSSDRARMVHKLRTERW